MFNPDKTIKSLTDNAYLSGSAFAAAIFPTAPVPDDPAWREQLCDVHCNAVVRAVGTVPHMNIDSIGPGVFASVYSGFTDCWNHMTMSPEDIEAIGQAFADDDAGSQISRATDGLLLSPQERRMSPRFNGANPEQEGLAVEFALETVRQPLSPHRLLEMAKALYEAEVGDPAPPVRLELSSTLRRSRQ